MRSRSLGWWALAVVSFAVAIYGLAYLVFRQRMFPPVVADSFLARPWGIYPHALFGGIALLLGPLQFHPRVQQNARVHRKLGITYVTAACLVGFVGLYMAFYSYGGAITHAGFGILGALTLVTTTSALRYAKMGDYTKHRQWMIRSFAMIFAAPTQRMWIGIGMFATGGNFDVAYRWSSWLCWALNLLVAELIIRRTRNEPLRFGGTPLTFTAPVERVGIPK